MDAPTPDQWTAAVEALFDATVWEVTRQVAAPRDTFSPNALERNGWTTREKVTFHLSVTLDGVDITESIAWQWAGGSYNRKSDAVADLAEAKSDAFDEWSTPGTMWDLLQGKIDDVMTNALTARLAVAP